MRKSGGRRKGDRGASAGGDQTGLIAPCRGQGGAESDSLTQMQISRPVEN